MLLSVSRARAAWCGDNGEVDKVNYEPRKQVMLRIRRIYYDLIASGEKTVELRADIQKWRWLLGVDPPDIARFVCGHDTHLRRITRIFYGDPEEILGRAVSEQGRKDLRLDGDRRAERCIAIELGEEWILCPHCGGLPWGSYKDDVSPPDYFGCDQCEKTFTLASKPGAMFCRGCPQFDDCPCPNGRRDWRQCSWKDTFIETGVWKK